MVNKFERNLFKNKLYNINIYMENQNVKRSCGNKTLSKEWYCDVCNNKHNYTLAGKNRHLKTKKHERNHNSISNMTLDDVIRREWIEFVKKDVFDTSRN